MTRAEELNLALKCDVCGKPPWWSLSREGDPCPDDHGHLVPAVTRAEELAEELKGLSADELGQLAWEGSVKWRMRAIPELARRAADAEALAEALEKIAATGKGGVGYDAHMALARYRGKPSSIRTLVEGRDE